MAAFLPSRYDHFPSADKISCILRAVSYEADAPCFKWGALLHSQSDCKTKVAGKQPYQQSITANRRKDETAEPCSRENGGASKHGSGRPETPPPEGGGATRMPIHDATVTPRTALPKGVTERQNFLNTHQVPSWEVDWRSPLCIHETRRPELRETG